MIVSNTGQAIQWDYDFHGSASFDQVTATWIHFAMALDNPAATMYIDGEAVNPGTELSAFGNGMPWGMVNLAGKTAGFMSAFSEPCERFLPWPMRMPKQIARQLISRAQFPPQTSSMSQAFPQTSSLTTLLSSVAHRLWLNDGHGFTPRFSHRPQWGAPLRWAHRRGARFDRHSVRIRSLGLVR